MSIVAAPLTVEILLRKRPWPSGGPLTSLAGFSTRKPHAALKHLARHTSYPTASIESSQPVSEVVEIDFALRL